VIIHADRGHPPGDGYPHILRSPPPALQSSHTGAATTSLKVVMPGRPAPYRREISGTCPHDAPGPVDRRQGSARAGNSPSARARRWPPGSYLALSHPAKDIDAESMAKMADSLNRTMAEKVTFRDRPAVARFFDGLELVAPGMVQASKWRPASDAEAASPAALWAGVARKA